jgi:CelD/BcsL family acetyltransferase involved in cellulose biosynthesis
LELYVRITIATSPAEIERLRPTWERLYSPEHQTAFQNFDLNLLAARHFAERESPYVVLAESDSSAAIIPAAIRANNGELTLLGEALFDYRDVLHAGTPDALGAAWAEIAKLERPMCFFAVRPEAQKRWDSIPSSDFANAPCVRHGDLDCDEFRAAHNKLGMYYRRLIKRGVHFHQRSGKECALVRTIYERKATQFPHEVNNIFLDAHRRDFMELACEALGEGCEIFTLENGADLIAALVTLRDETARRFYTIYFDPAWAKFSPGIVLIYEVTARTLGEGLDCDYMTGEYGYKNRLATALVPLRKVEASAAELAAIASRRKAA